MDSSSLRRSNGISQAIFNERPVFVQRDPIRQMGDAIISVQKGHTIEDDSLSLRPVYDMCAMGFAPKSGEVLAFKFQCKHGLKPDMASGQISHARGMADDFWNCLAGDTRLSDEFRTYLQQANPIDVPDKTN